MLRSIFLPLVTLSALFLLPGCSGGWLGESEPVPLPGERIPVLVYDQTLQADPGLAATPLQLPAPVQNTLWPTAGGRAAHDGGVYELAGEVRRAWSEDIGDGTDDDDRPLMALPVVENGRIYALDTGGRLSALDTPTGRKLWQVETAPRALRDKAGGGGVAVADGRVYVSLGYGEVAAFSVEDGSEIWRQTTPSPLRSAPTVAQGQIYVVSIDNQLGALKAADGAINWVHAGLTEAAGLLGTPGPAAAGDVVLVAYSSGELYALRALNGGELWSDNLSANRREGGVSSIAAIRGMPVLAAGGAVALAISNSGRLVAVDTRSGQRMWEQRLGGAQMPWVAGDTVFVVSNQAQLAAINLRDGRLRWVKQLALWEHPEDSEGLVVWYGPVLAGGRLWLTNNLGRLESFDPVTGNPVATLKLGTPASRPPLVVGGTLFTLDDEARLTAWR